MDSEKSIYLFEIKKNDFSSSRYLIRENTKFFLKFHKKEMEHKWKIKRVSKFVFFEIFIFQVRDTCYEKIRKFFRNFTKRKWNTNAKSNVFWNLFIFRNIRSIAKPTLYFLKIFYYFYIFDLQYIFFNKKIKLGVIHFSYTLIFHFISTHYWVRMCKKKNKFSAPRLIEKLCLLPFLNKK